MTRVTMKHCFIQYTHDMRNRYKVTEDSYKILRERNKTAPDVTERASIS